ncbi:MAG: choice-of-anchor D domain-containing protein [Blastocatellia bacterium]|nr:choice-of-anchor D domain-containing protein [Blastocatellia bacterium]
MFILRRLLILCGALLFLSWQGFGGEKPETALTFTVQLKFRDEAGLRALVADRNNPQSPNYHRWLTEQEFERRFAPAEASRSQVESWLTKQGFEIVNRHNHGRLLVCRTSQTNLKRNLRQDGTQGSSFNTTAISAAVPVGLPQELTSLVAAVEGLEPLSRASGTQKVPAGSLQKTLDPKLGSCSFEDLIYPQDFLKLYGFTDAHASGLTGRGQKIGVIIPGAFSSSDYDMFRASYNLPQSPVEQVNLPGTSVSTVFPDPMGGLEYLSVAAPGAILKVLQVPADGFGTISGTNFVTAMAFAADNFKDCNVLFGDFGQCESTLTSATFTTVENLLLQSAAQGKTWVFPTGERGVDACQSGRAAVLYPASSPLVTAVGGTDLIVTRDSDSRITGYIGETAWNNSEGSGGGGASTAFAMPEYQKKLDLNLGVKRLVPDVSMHAAGNLVIVYNNTKTCFTGTSVPTAAWAGLFSLINQSVGGEGLGQANVALYTLGTNQTSETGPTIFNDVLTGNNFVNNISGNITGPGYDAVTGWGSGRVVPLIQNFLSGLPRPGVNLTATSVDFGTLGVGKKSDKKTITIQSVGNLALQVRSLKLDAAALAAGFAIEPCPDTVACAPPFSIEPRESADIQVSWTPTKAEVQTGTLTITTNAPGRSDLTVPLTGKGSDDAIPPRVTVLSQFGNNSFSPGEKVMIKWSSSDDRGVVSHTIEFSRNNGGTYDTVIATGISGQATFYEWVIPDSIATNQGKIRVAALDEARNIGSDTSSGIISILDKTPPSVTFLPLPFESFQIGETVTFTWSASDSSGIAAQELALKAGTNVITIATLDSVQRSFTWDTSQIDAGPNLQLVLTVRDSAGNAAVANSASFAARPKLAQIVTAAKSATLTGLGFRKDVTNVLVNGLALDRNVITVDSATSITLKGKPKKLRITPGSSISVQVNGVESNEITFR